MGSPGPRRNFAVLAMASVLFGLSIGIYDLLLPYYLDDLGLGFASMGIVFSLGALIVAFFSIYIASTSDAGTRKNAYSLGILLGSMSALIAPITASIPVLVISKTFREAAVNIRASLHGVLIFEFAREKFADYWAKSRGLEYLSEGSGQLIAGALLLTLGFLRSFLFASLLLVFSLAVFVLGFREQRKPPEQNPSPGVRTFDRDMSRPLLLLTLSAFIFAVGLSISHSFILPLYFAKKFGASVAQVSLILGLHRMSFLPLLVTGRVVEFPLKKVYVASMFFEGMIILSSSVAPGLFLSAAVWLTHDVLGASLWLPAQASLIQYHARDEHRGRDVSRVRAIGALGWIVGPLVAGWASSISISLPFALSGLIVAASIIPILGVDEPPTKGRIEIGGGSPGAYRRKTS
jgi:MFS family permease